MTGSMKKRRRKAEAKQTMKGMKNLIGEVRSKRAEEKRREQEETFPAPPVATSGPASASVPARSPPPSPSSSRRPRHPTGNPPPPPRHLPAVPERGDAGASLSPYSTATQDEAASALLVAADRAYADGRVDDAARYYEGAAAENGSGWAPLMALRAHEGNLERATEALRAAAAAAGDPAASPVRAMADALGKLVRSAAAAAREDDFPASAREDDFPSASSTSLPGPASASARLSFPTPVGWWEGTPSPVGASARARLVSSARGALAAGLAYRATGDAAAAAEALRAASSDAHGWRLAARVATAAARATEYAAPETSRGYYAVAGSIFVARVADVSDPLEVVAESEWAMRGTDSIAAEDARGEVISAAADAVAERFVAAVAALPPPASDAAKESTGRRDAIAAEARRLVACAASTGETGADAARDAAYRAADAAWALRCRDEHATRAAAHAAAPDSRDAASSLADAAVALASAAAPSNAVGWRPESVLAHCLASCVAIASPSRELVDAMAALAPLDAGAAVRAPLARLADKLDASSDGTVPLAPSATLAATAAARASFIASTLDATRAVAVGGSRAAATAASSCASEIFSDAMVASAGAAARDALDVGRETPPDRAFDAWWIGNHAQCAVDPLDPDPGRSDPVPRLERLAPELRMRAPRARRTEIPNEMPAEIPNERPARDEATTEARAEMTIPEEENDESETGTGMGTGTGNLSANPGDEISGDSRFIASSSPARVSVPDAVDVEVERSRAEIGALRASLAETRAHDAEATRASFEGAKARLLSASAKSSTRVSADAVAASFASGTDASLTFDVSRVSDATEDPRVEAKEWNVVLPDELEAGADGTRMSDETSEDATTERGEDDSSAEESSAGESSAEESSAGDAAPTARPDEDSGANVSNVSNVASDDEKESESGTFFDAQEDLPPAERGSQTFASGHETPSSSSAVPAMDAAAAAASRSAVKSAKSARDRRRRDAARREVARAAALREVKTLCRGWRRRADGPDPLPATATAGRSKSTHAAAHPADEETTRAERAAAAAGFPRNGLVDAPELPSRVVPLLTTFDTRRAALRDDRAVATHLRLFTREAIRRAAAEAAAKTAAAAATEAHASSSSDASVTWGDGEIRGLRTAAAVAAAVEEATAETEARLVRALTDASPDQLRALETAIRAVRGDSPIPSPRGRRDASASLVDAGVGPATPATDEKESRSAVRSQSNRVAADEEAAMGYPFTVEAALRRFGPRPSSPIRADAVVAAAADAAAEAAKLGPTAQEMYYASYKAAMDAAVGALDAHDASATMAAAAGAARAVRSGALHDGHLRSVHEISTLAFGGAPIDAPLRAARPMSRGRVGSMLARRRAAAAAAARSALDKIAGDDPDRHALARVRDAVAEAERSRERLDAVVGAEARDAYRAGVRGATLDERSPQSTSSRPLVPALKIAGTVADLSLHGGGAATAPPAPRAIVPDANAPSIAETYVVHPRPSPPRRDETNETETSSGYSSADSDRTTSTSISVEGLDTTVAQEAAAASAEEAAAAATAAAIDAAVAAAIDAAAPRPEIPEDPFARILAWTQARGGRAFARAWEMASHAPRTGGVLRGVGTSKSPASRGGDVLDRVELARLLESELGAFSPKSSAYLHACLSAEHGEEITLGEFVKATRECAKITAAAERHLPWDVDEPRERPVGGGGFSTPGKNVAFSTPGKRAAKSPTRTGASPAPPRGNDAALARVASLVDAAVGTLKRKFQKSGDALRPEALATALAEASASPSDVRATLAELRVWDGFPLKIRFARLLATVRPRASRVLERETKRRTAGDAARAAVEADVAAGRFVTIVAPTTKDEDEAEEKVRRDGATEPHRDSASAGPAGLVSSPSGSPTSAPKPRAGLPPSSPAALEREIDVELAAERAVREADAVTAARREAVTFGSPSRVAADVSLDGVAADARDAARKSAERARRLAAAFANEDEDEDEDAAASRFPSSASRFPFSSRFESFATPPTSRSPHSRVVHAGLRASRPRRVHFGGETFELGSPGSRASATPPSTGGKLQAARDRRKRAEAAEASPFSPATESKAATARREMEAALRLESVGDPFANEDEGERWWTGASAAERAVLVAGKSPASSSSTSRLERSKPTDATRAARASASDARKIRAHARGGGGDARGGRERRSRGRGGGASSFGGGGGGDGRVPRVEHGASRARGGRRIARVRSRGVHANDGRHREGAGREGAGAGETRRGRGEEAQGTRRGGGTRQGRRARRRRARQARRVNEIARASRDESTRARRRLRFARRVDDALASG